jgi:hypothetical protein
MIRSILLVVLWLPSITAAQPAASERDLAALVETANWFQFHEVV